MLTVRPWESICTCVSVLCILNVNTVTEGIADDEMALKLIYSLYPHNAIVSQVRA